jgi:glycerol uptake facilitator-like aquaporin
VSVLALGTTGDPSGGGIVIAWLLAWPLAAVALGALPLIFVARAHALGSALVLTFAVAATAPYILAQVLGASEG